MLRVVLSSEPIRHFVVLHYHFRPGGVRRVIELTLPHLAEAVGPSLVSFTLALGEHPAEVPVLSDPPLTLFVEPTFSYLAEQSASPAAVRLAIRRALERLIPNPQNSVLWFHNSALARNVLLADEVRLMAAKTNLRLLLHHHDFWCAGRWSRWPEMVNAGFHTPETVARAIFCESTRAVHITINASDHQSLCEGWPTQTKFLANPVTPPVATDRSRAKSWLRTELQSEAAVWVCPTRFLRRKNLVESLLLTRWLAPEAWFVTTAGRGSAEEHAYEKRLREATRGWQVRWGILRESSAPSVHEILAVADVVVITSVQEGFGMAFVEGASAGTPLIARALPDAMRTLTSLGYEFPNLYHEITICPSLFDVDAEAARVRSAFSESTAALPLVWQGLASQPEQAWPFFFSRLSLTAQLEVLKASPSRSWTACAPLNPRLVALRQAVINDHLPLTPWPQAAQRSASSYAAELVEFAQQLRPTSPPVERADAAQYRILTQALKPEALFPILLPIE